MNEMVVFTLWICLWACIPLVFVLVGWIGGNGRPDTPWDLIDKARIKVIHDKRIAEQERRINEIPDSPATADVKERFRKLEKTLDRLDAKVS